MLRVRATTLVPTIVHKYHYICSARAFIFIFPFEGCESRVLTDNWIDFNLLIRYLGTSHVITTNRYSCSLLNCAACQAFHSNRLLCWENFFKKDFEFLYWMWHFCSIINLEHQEKWLNVFSGKRNCFLL